MRWEGPSRETGSCGETRAPQLLLLYTQPQSARGLRSALPVSALILRFVLRENRPFQHSAGSALASVMAFAPEGSCRTSTLHNAAERLVALAGDKRDRAG
jgi:hypothetical protein